LADRYTLERELGRDGMAAVHLAQDPKHDHSVPLKVLYPELVAALSPERFLGEIRLTTWITAPPHPRSEQRSAAGGGGVR
jgi:eukaryotic-like serine/threonine-protein kinase